MILGAHQLNYLPYPGLISKINFVDKFIYLTKVQFEKKSWQSRNKIINGEKELLLSVPIKKNDFYNIGDIEINNETNWKKKHFRSIEKNYKNSSFYQKYMKFFEEIFSYDWHKLSELNVYILNFIINELNIKTEIISDRNFEFTKKKNEFLIEMCNLTNSDTYISNLGSQEYVDLNLFKKNKINHFFINYNEFLYPQNTKKFVSNLTIFDMLFFCGPNKTEKIIKDKKNLSISNKNSRL